MTDGKKRLLDIVRPAYIILKPSLHGGMRGVEEWVRLAEERHIGSWITSALESNIGLNAIAQLAARIYGPGIKLPFRGRYAFGDTGRSAGKEFHRLRLRSPFRQKIIQFHFAESHISLFFNSNGELTLSENRQPVPRPCGNLIPGP